MNRKPAHNSGLAIGGLNGFVSIPIAIGMQNSTSVLRLKYSGKILAGTPSPRPLAI